MKYYCNMFAINSKLFLVFGIQLWILTGWFTSSAQGLQCFYCQTLEVTSSSGAAVAGANPVDALCVTPVQGTTPGMTCPPGYSHCVKQTMAKQYTTAGGETIKGKILRRSCAGANEKPSVCKKIDLKAKPSELGFALLPNKNLPRTMKKAIGADGKTIIGQESDHNQCICNTADFCNKEPGLDGSGTAPSPSGAAS